MERSFTEDRIREIFTSALELAPDSRTAFVQRECGANRPLTERIFALLEAHAESEVFFADLASVSLTVEPIPELLPGEVVGDRFTIVRPLGQGGSGDIYEARDSELGDTVALKVLRAWTAAEDLSDQFREEVRLARKVLNSHVCRVHDVGRHCFRNGTCLFLTMEMLPGRTLAKFLKEERGARLEERYGLVRQIAEGLEAAHRARVVHGDLKSSNVIVLQESSGRLRAVITDFGLARYVGSRNPLLVGGTPAYMAPEQVNGAESGFATDIYSFGVVAFETLTGTLPFSGPNRDEVAQAKLLHPAAEVRTVHAGIGPSWNRVVAKCLERDPAKRYRSIEEAIGDLPGREPAGSTRRRWIVGATIAGIGSVLGARIFIATKTNYANTIVVLPFHGDSGPAEPVAASMSEQLASTFSKVPGMRVIAPTTAGFYAQRQVKLAEIGSELQVRAVLGGSVRNTQQGIRIAAELSDTRSGRLLWSESYDMRMEDLRRAHETIARAVIRNLSFQLSPDQTELVIGRHATSEAAYSLYLLGQHFANKRDGVSLDESIRYFSQAIEADPRWAVARGALADAYNLIATKGIIPAISAYEFAKVHANEALKLDERVPEAHMALAGVAEYSSWSWSEAALHHKRAVDLDPGSAEAYSRRAGYLSMQGRMQEALAMSQTAVELDPLSIHIASFNATDLYRARRIDEAMQRLDWILRREPEYVNAHVRLADCHGQKGNYAEAHRLAGWAVEKTDRAAYALGSLGEFAALSQRVEEARSLVKELESLYFRGMSSPCYIAQVHRGLRDFDRCFEWIARGLVEHDSDLPGFNADPANDAIRSDPRFLRMVTAVGM